MGANSNRGWCGNSTDYCGDGCQSAFGVCSASSTGSDVGGVDGRCGPNFSNTSCSETACCSAAGYCGTTSDHCRAPDCLFQYGPACDANKIPSGQNTSSIARNQVGSVEYGGNGIYSCVTAGDIALTYDDGPANFTSHLLDLLKQYNASATFMVTGNNNAKGQIDDTSLPWPDLLKRMYNEGHQIASHTWSHADLCNITSAQRKDEMYKNEMAIRNVLGMFPTYMRPPYSSCTAECGCEADMASLGYHVVYFDVDTQDYLNDSPTLIQNSKNIWDQAIASKTPATDDELVIGHDIHEQTVYNLTEYMLKSLVDKGFKPVTVGECLGDAKENWYRTDTSTTIGSTD
ncbi:glycoside hydrolase/deacetylase [Thozetella sp. PMI_491]|nr:glycoside hydrolase/deacetylase [Thozetella sp. PMI_491]